MTKVFSMFSGIGGFELGLLMSEKNVKLVGYSEIDKYAIEVFQKRFKGINNYGNATIIDETKLPNFDLLVGGFPCQAFSVAGRQRGFDDTRGTLFFDVARILKHKKPKHFILENVRGLLSTLGIWCNGKYAIVRTTESRRIGKECILSDILEETVDPKYFLSEKSMKKIVETTSQRK